MRRGMLRLAALMVAGSGLGALAAGGSGNSANDNLLAMSPEQQAQMLTKGIKDCVGESPFPMGVMQTGKAKGYAYWSVRCKDGRSFAIQSHRSRRRQPLIASSWWVPARSASRSSERAHRQPPSAGDHQRIGWRQTEYQRPRFSSFHFGSSQSFLRSAADACGSEGGTGVLEEHPATAISSARIADLISASPDLLSGPRSIHRSTRFSAAPAANARRCGSPDGGAVRPPLKRL